MVADAVVGLAASLRVLLPDELCRFVLWISPDIQLLSASVARVYRLVARKL